MSRRKKQDLQKDELSVNYNYLAEGYECPTS